MPIRTATGTRRERLTNHTQCEIDNPLAHLSPDELFQSASDFARRISPRSPDTPFWRKVALVARYQQVPQFCDRLKDLTDLEKEAIREQRALGFWRQPKPLRVTIVTLCLAAMIQGWVQTGLNGANLSWGKQFGLSSRDGPPTTTRELWIFAVTNACLYFSASILGCWLSDPLQSLILGRRGALFFSACLCIAGAIGSGFSKTWPQLLGCRIVLGAAMGAKASVAPMYGAEVSPTHLRGALVMNWQLYTAAGIFLGFAANLMVSQIGENKWRYEVASAAIPALVLLSIVWTIPEYPRWLLKKGRYRDAFESFSALRETRLQAGAELFYANAQIQAEIKLLGRVRHLDVQSERHQSTNGHAIGRSVQEIEREYIRQGTNGDPDVSRPMEVARPRRLTQVSNAAQPEDSTRKEERRAPIGCLPLPKRLERFWNSITGSQDDIDLEEYQRCAKASFYVTRIWQLFSMPRIRRATSASLVMMISQQLCGINILQFYSTTFFHDPGQTSNSLLGPGLSLGFGLANFLFTFPIYSLIDRRGRRFLLLSSYPGMIFSMLGASLSYNIKDETNRLGVVVLFMFLFVFFYSWGQGPVPFAYSSEVFPLLNREAGMSFAVFTNLFGAGVLALVVPQLTQALASQPLEDESSRTGESRLLGIFTGLNVVALTLIFFFVPETAGATLGVSETQGLNYISLEELNYIFNVKTAKHIRYQIGEIVPWAWKVFVWKIRRYILRNKVEQRPDDPDQLYTWVIIQQLNEASDESTGQSERDAGE
ncbi:MFS general substrate transporter [Pyrenochaeta sp. DS3sAY3a]|nr:MFS general substrate transporter [Pyrenochaeta sp. DS3sAY3a]